MGAPEAPQEQKESENEIMKKELQALKPELKHIKNEVSRSSMFANVLWCGGNFICLKKLVKLNIT